MPLQDCHKRKRSWSAEDDYELIQAVRSARPWDCRHGTKIPSWTAITAKLSQRNVNWRTAKNRFQELVDCKDKGILIKRRATIGIPPSYVDKQLGECLELMKKHPVDHDISSKHSEKNSASRSEELSTCFDTMNSSFGERGLDFENMYSFSNYLDPMTRIRQHCEKIAKMEPIDREIEVLKKEIQLEKLKRELRELKEN